MDSRRSQKTKFLEKCSCSCSDSNSNSHDHHANKNMKQNSNCCKVTSKLFLPQDLMFQIYTLIPLHCMLNSARYVCKSWAATIRSSTFTEACQREPLRARFKSGLYVENRESENSSYFLEFKDDDVNGHFERIDLGTPPNMGHLIGTCDGILLLLSPCGYIFVANPILKCWLRIPHFPISQHHILVGCQCTIARVPRTTKFKLFFIDVLEVSGASWYIFYVLRIGIDNSWKEIARKEAPLHWYFLWKPLYSGGNYLYWITKEKVIVMDVDKEIIVREYPLPPLTMSCGPLAIFLWMGDRLSCIVSKYSYGTTYLIYILDFDSGKWSLYHEMGPFDDIAVSNMVFRLWINDQIIFQVALPQYLIGNIIARIKNIHFGYNVKTKQLTKIKDIDVGDFEVWLHTNSLVSLSSTLA